MVRRPTLYALPASHPCAAVERALQLKGLAYERVDMLPVASAVQQRVTFGRRTVPALRLAGDERVVGSRAIMRVIDGLEPQPPLLPADPALRAKVEAAETWGDDVLQTVGRRLAWAIFRRRPDTMLSYAENADLPLPDAIVARGAGTVARIASAVNRAGDDTVRADLEALPGHLDRIDGWIADGVLGAEAVNVADLQIGSGVRLLQTFGDLEPLVRDRPAAALARRLFPVYAGHAPAGVLPAAWLPAAG